MSISRVLCRCRRSLLVVLFAGCVGWTSPALADRLQEIQDRGHLIVGVKEDIAPFGYRDTNGELVGYDVDVARGLAEAVGVEIQLVPVNSVTRMVRLVSGEIDVVAATLGDTPSRRELVTMIEPQYYGDGANVLLRTDADIRSWADLHGRPICGLQGSLWNRLAEQRLLLDVTAFNSTGEVREALRKDRCVGWLHDEVFLLEELATGEWEDFGLSLPTRFVLTWAVAIAKEEGGGRLDHVLGDTLARWHRSGYLQSLEKKWGLPPSPFLRDARATWQEVDGTGALKCRRDDAGQWPRECREVALGGDESQNETSYEDKGRLIEKYVETLEQIEELQPRFNEVVQYLMGLTTGASNVRNEPHLAFLEDIVKMREALLSREYIENELTQMGLGSIIVR